MIYFDHAATSLPRSANAVTAAMRATELATPGRGHHSLQAAAGAACEGARDAVARLLPDGYTVVFGSGATAALSQAILGLRPRPSIVACDALCHNAVRRPLARLARQGTEVWTLPHESHSGRIDLARTLAEWKNGTTVVVVTHGSNVTGLVQPVADLVRVAHARGARVIVDAAQTAGLLVPLPVGDADLVAFSAHKGLAALPGTGVLAVRGDVLLEPLVLGGTGFDSAADDMPADLPARLEAGTPNLPGIAAMGAAAVDAVHNAFDAQAGAVALADALLRAGLEPITARDLPIALVDPRRSGWAVSTLEVEEALDRVYGVVARSGTFCAPRAIETLGLSDGAVRFSSGRGTTAADLSTLTEVLRELAKALSQRTKRARA